MTSGSSRFLSALSIFLLLSGCSAGLRVQTDTDPDYDLWAYKSFSWSPNTNIEESKNPIYYNELNDKRIKMAVTAEMVKLGYLQKEHNPDLIIHYHIIVEDQSTVLGDPLGYHGAYWIGLDSQVYKYKMGTLIIDIMDPKSKNLIWRGWAKAFVDEQASPRQVNQLVNKATRRMFNQFPKKHESLPAPVAVC
jgi:Domain of unknown function (DUF4136)